MGHKARKPMPRYAVCSSCDEVHALKDSRTFWHHGCPAEGAAATNVRDGDVGPVGDCVACGETVHVYRGQIGRHYCNGEPIDPSEEQRKLIRAARAQARRNRDKRRAAQARWQEWKREREKRLEAVRPFMEQRCGDFLCGCCGPVACGRCGDVIDMRKGVPQKCEGCERLTRRLNVERLERSTAEQRHAAELAERRRHRLEQRITRAIRAKHPPLTLCRFCSTWNKRGHVCPQRRERLRSE